MSVEVYLQIHATLEAHQRAEPYHQKIGSVDKKGNRIPIDEICGACPTRKRCGKLSIALADLHSGRITDEQALAQTNKAQ